MRLRHLLAATAMAFATAAAHADILNFTITAGNRASTNSQDLTGSFTLDTTNNKVVSITVTYNGGTMTDMGANLSPNSASDETFTFGPSLMDTITFTTPNPFSNISYASANPGSFSASLNGIAYNGHYGQAAAPPPPVMAPTPEPSAIVLLGTGLLGVAGVVRRRLNPAASQA